ncbi:-Structural maintenance of chromosomes protein 6 [Babesia bigemina]|uniref:-Structural maintenance of chromosomes protein 6 n=1 Tax=Babesia bigemina TaxID=5866 RepID=A0A061DBB3_BABBI|nr:-Structural maintenance of chromosomes protein 6 [Babesia bigemina]CDR97808.1 -Structural maintenance of chromosomes protein 6 [Babesia bigemina]|eukprot:XP_012769994.1 -Structural maintenance of chromosomes protein 6 [Babesia bigemina]
MDAREERAAEGATPELGDSTSATLPEAFENSAGKVVKVQLINFLNHANLLIHCSPYLNMIFGMNGLTQRTEGKSAIVQGMALCFGGYGHSAGRDTALLHYIKDYHLRDGPSYARVEVTLSNQGDGAYKPELYGDAIVLARVIHKNHSSFYMGGTLVKKATVNKKEVDRYLRHIKMSIGNPTTYMDQESSKSFFFHSNPSSFYRYYSAAAGLVEMEQNLSTEKRNLEECKAELKVRKRVLHPDREKLRDLSKQISLFEEKLTEWKSAKEMYRLSQYRAYKERYEALKETYDRFHQTDPKDEIVKLQNSIELFSAEHEEVKFDMQTQTSKTYHHKDSITTITDQIAVLNDSIGDMQSRISAKKACISQVETAMANLDGELSAVAAEPADADKKCLERELDVCRKEYEDVTEQQESTSSAMADIESAIEDIETQIQKAKIDLDEQRRENASLEFSTVPSVRSDPLRRALYRYDVNAVREDIQRMRDQGVFIYMPIGPIGDYLVVTRDAPTWKVLAVVEHHLRSMVHTWVVASEQDRRALESLLIKHGCSRSQSKIIKSNVFMRPDLVERMQRKLSTMSHRQSIYSYLAVKEIPPLLLYVLDDVCGIGRAVICIDDEQMYEVLSEGGDKVNVVYSLTRLNSGRRLNGSLYLSPCYEKHPFSYEYGNEGDYSWEREERKDSGTQRESSLKSLLSSLSKELSECNSRLNAHRSKLDEIKAEQTRVIRKRTRLETDLETELDSLQSTSHSSRYNKCCEALEEIRSDYRRQLKALGAELATLEAELSAMESNKATKEEELKVANSDLKATLKTVSSLKVDMQKIQQRINTQKTQIKALQKNMEDYNFKLDGYVNDLKEAEKKLESHKAELEAEGIDYSAELPTKSPEDYLQILNLSNDVLKRIVDDSRNIEAHLQSLREKHAAAEQSLRDKELRLTETTENYSLQKKNYVKRCRRFEECRARIEHKAKKAFRQTLDAVTGYDGNLVFNDVNRTLDIQIHNKQQSYSRAHLATDLKTLSGGEQSAIQLSMLQSLATISFSPIHMFDEVDVYMDESTRIKNIESLVQFAANNKNRQIFLVTPHSELAKHIKDKYPDISKIFNVARDV